MNRRLPSPLLPAFESLAAHLLELYGNRPVYYFGNPGNWGDALIRQGTLQFLRDTGISFEEVFPDRPFRVRPGAVLLYGGGGAWCSFWEHSPRVLQQIGHRFEHTVVLPSTFEKTYEIPNTDYYARDRYESLTHMPRARFCHDMAFYLGRVAAPPGTGEGFFFRTDQERAGNLELPATNLDISTQGTHLTPIQGFFAATARFAVIHTDRLHVAIAAALMGRELHFYPGAYFKNYAIFRSSLEGNFERACFESDAAS